MHIARDQRSKLDSKTRPCIFLGYSEDEFGYRFWDLIDKKVVRSRDIVFMEDKTIEDWKQKLPLSSSHPATVIDLVFPDTRPVHPVSVQQSDDIQQEDVHDADNDDGDVEPPESVETELQETPVEPTAELRRYPVRQRQSSSRYPASEYVLLTDDGEP